MTDDIDLATITDIDKLKSLAYDQIGMLQAVQNNLNQINARIEELSVPAPIMNGNREARRAAAKKA